MRSSRGAFAAAGAGVPVLGAVGWRGVLRHGGEESAGKLGGVGVGPGEAGDDGGELLGVDGGDAVELSGEDAADGGLVLLGSVLEHGDVMAREADAQFGGAQGVREDAVGVVAE